MHKSLSHAKKKIYMPRELNVMKIFVQGLCIKILHVSNYNIIPVFIHDVKIVRFKIVGIS